MATTTRPGRTDGDGTSGQVGDLALRPPRAGRRGRLPEIAVGAVLMVGFALAAVLWHMSSVERDAVLALASDVSRGEVVEAGDLDVAYVGSDDGIASLSEAETASVVGRVALADLTAGTLVTPGLVSDEAAVAAGEGVVGLALEPGQLPTSGLLPGDTVNVVAAEPGDAGAAGPLVEPAEVFSVEDADSQGRRVVAVKMPEESANAVAAAAERGPVRLVVVGR